MPSTEAVSYTRTAKFLHWLIAAAILFMLGLGWTFDYFEDSTKFALFQLHKSIGITILFLVFVRLGWRASHTPPPLPASMPTWEKYAAHFGHILLYGAMIAMPLSGWIMVSASSHNIPTILYGLVHWPSFPGVATSPDKETIDDVTDFIHKYLALAFAALIAGHALAAWRHHLIIKDDILLRMAPRCFANVLTRMRKKP